MSDWRIVEQKTGLQLWNGDRIGGWQCVHRHFFVLDTYARKIPGADALLKARGFERKEHPPGRYFWRIPEDRFRDFALTVKELDDLTQ